MPVVIIKYVKWLSFYLTDLTQRNSTRHSLSSVNIMSVCGCGCSNLQVKCNCHCHLNYSLHQLTIICLYFTSHELVYISYNIVLYCMSFHDIVLHCLVHTEQDWKDLQRVDKAAKGVIRITVHMTKIWQRYTLWLAQEDQLNNKENNPLWTLPFIPLHFTF